MTDAHTLLLLLTEAQGTGTDESDVDTLLLLLTEAQGTETDETDVDTLLLLLTEAQRTETDETDVDTLLLLLTEAHTLLFLLTEAQGTEADEPDVDTLLLLLTETQGTESSLPNSLLASFLIRLSQSHLRLTDRRKKVKNKKGPNEETTRINITTRFALRSETGKRVQGKDISTRFALFETNQ